MSRLDYSKFSQKQRPTSAAIPNLALTAGPSGASASDEQTDSATLDTGHSKIWDFVAKLSGTELEDRQGISTEEKKTHKCLICSVTLAQHHIRFAISLWCVVKKRPFFIALDAEFRSFVGGLDARYVPPHRETCWKIVNVIVELLKESFAEMIQQVKAEAEAGEPYGQLVFR